MKQIFCITKTDITTYKVGNNFEVGPEGTNFGFNFTPEALKELLEDYREVQDNSLSSSYSDLQAVFNYVNRKMLPKSLAAKLAEWEQYATKADRELVFEIR